MVKAKTDPTVRQITAYAAWDLAVTGDTLTVPAPCVLAPEEGLTIDGPTSADKGRLNVSVDPVGYPVVTVTAS